MIPCDEKDEFMFNLLLLNYLYYIAINAFRFVSFPLINVCSIWYDSFCNATKWQVREISCDA